MQKLVRLEEVEVKVEEQPKGETIVRSVGKALRTPGKSTTFTLFEYVWAAAPLVVFYLSSLVVS